jgi:hypothetical protein
MFRLKDIPLGRSLVPKKRDGRDTTQKLVAKRAPDPMEVLTDDNRAVLAFFASEIASYLEVGINRRLEEIEYRLREMDARNVAGEEARAVREILQLFSRYKLFRILRALAGFASEDREFTKNTLIRFAGVGQGFRRDGLDRLIDILCSKGLLLEVGKRGRGILFSVTSTGKSFMLSYIPRSAPFTPPLPGDNEGGEA